MDNNPLQGSVTELAQRAVYMSSTQELDSKGTLQYCCTQAEQMTRWYHAREESHAQAVLLFFEELNHIRRQKGVYSAGDLFQISFQMLHPKAKGVVPFSVAFPARCYPDTAISVTYGEAKDGKWVEGRITVSPGVLFTELEDPNVSLLYEDDVMAFLNDLSTIIGNTALFREETSEA